MHSLPRSATFSFVNNKILSRNQGYAPWGALWRKAVSRMFAHREDRTTYAGQTAEGFASAVRQGTVSGSSPEPWFLERIT